MGYGAGYFCKWRVGYVLIANEEGDSTNIVDSYFLLSSCISSLNKHMPLFVHVQSSAALQFPLFIFRRAM